MRIPHQAALPRATSMLWVASTAMTMAPKVARWRAARRGSASSDFALRPTARSWRGASMMVVSAVMAGSESVCARGPIVAAGRRRVIAQHHECERKKGRRPRPPSYRRGSSPSGGSAGRDWLAAGPRSSPGPSQAHASVLIPRCESWIVTPSEASWCCWGCWRSFRTLLPPALCSHVAAGVPHRPRQARQGEGREVRTHHVRWCVRPLLSSADDP